MKLNRVYAVILVIIYFILFCSSYINSITIEFSYMGLIYNNLDIEAWLYISLLSLSPALWLSDCDRPSTMAIWIIYVVVFMPSIIVPVFVKTSNFSDLIILGFILYISLFLINRICVLKLYNIPRLKLRYDVFLSGYGLIYIALCVYILAEFGFKINALSIDTTYDVRAEYKIAMAHIGGISGYLMMWMGNIINILCFLKCILNNKYKYAVFFFTIQLWLVSISAFKSWLFSPILIILLCFLQKYKFRANLIVLAGVDVLMLIGYTISSMFGDILLESLFTRRMLMIPGLLTGYYHEFFGINGFAFLSHSIFSYFISPVYFSAPPTIIGGLYFHADTNANASFFMDGYANFGYLGIIIMSSILGFILYIYDSVTVHIDHKIAQIMLAPIAISLSNGALLTNLLTGGILLLLFIFWIMPAENTKQ